MDLNNYITINDLAKKYGLNPDTIRSYIARGQVIPDDKKFKVGNTWLIEKKFAEEKWGKRR